MDLVKHNGSWKFRTILRLPPAYGTQRHQFSSKGLPPLYSARSRASCPDVCTPSVCGERDNGSAAVAVLLAQVAWCFSYYWYQVSTT